MKWVMFRKRYVPAIIPIIYYWSWPVSDILKVKRKIGVDIWEKGDYTVLWEKESHDNVANYALNYFKKRINSLGKIRKKGIKAGQNVVKYCEKFCKNLNQKKYEDFILFFEGLEKKYHEFIKKSVVYWLFTESLIEEKINKQLKSYNNQEKQEILKIMTIPPSPSYSKIEEKEFEQLVKLAKRRGIKSIQKRIENFSKKYFWFPYEYVGPDIWDVKSVKNRVIKNLKNPKEKIKEINIKEKQKLCIKKFKLSKKTVNLFKILHNLILMQDDRKMFNSHACYYINQKVGSELAKRLNTDIKYIRYLDVGLFREFLKHKDKKKLHKILKKRENFLIYTRTDTEGKFYIGKEGEKVLKNFKIDIKEKRQDIIKGSIANQGKVKGKARILLSSSGVKNFKQGDILVTPMTTPDFIQYIKKAAAIVTDEGGITCHAAIISRELDIPCIVGTKNATKSLKNGNLVEVDANKGVVRRLK